MSAVLLYMVMKAWFHLELASSLALQKEMSSISHLPWWKNLRAVQSGRVALVDGNHMFNRSGPRVVDALEWLVAIFHDVPELCPTNFPWEWWQPMDGVDKWKQLERVKGKT